MMSVYLAGPGVFRLDARAHGQDLVALAARYGLRGLYPLDGDLGTIAGFSGPALANRIRMANEDLIKMADGIIADMTPFRGPSMDAGTAYEIGYARALGIPVIGYVGKALDLVDYLDRVTPPGENLPTALNDCGQVVPIAPDGMSVEDFGLNDNLMMASGLAGLYVGAEEAMKAMVKTIKVC